MKIINENKLNNLSLSELESLYRVFKGKKKELLDLNNIKAINEIEEVILLIKEKLNQLINDIFEFENKLTNGTN